MFSGDGKDGTALVHVRWKDGNLQAFALRNQPRNFLRVPGVRGKECVHVLHWIVRLHVCGLIRDLSVACSVRFVESVRGERFDERPERLRFVLGEFAELDKSFQQFSFLLLHHFWNFLSHRFAERVSLKP